MVEAIYITVAIHLEMKLRVLGSYVSPRHGSRACDCEGRHSTSRKIWKGRHDGSSIEIDCPLSDFQPSLALTNQFDRV